MIYLFIKWVTRIAIRVFFRKIYFYNKDIIKPGIPTILAINHPTAFIDPIFVATHITPKTYTMLRGDLFNSPFKIWLLDQIGTIPIFRFRNGFEGMRQNQDTFERCYDLLNKNACISILSEGNMKHEKRLRPIQKGTAKMALGVYEKYQNEAVQIIPVGVNYSDSNQMRSVLMANVGEPILIKDYLNAYRENPRKAILQITREIERQLKERVIHIADPADDSWINQILEIQQNNLESTVWPGYAETDTLRQQQMTLVQHLNEKTEAEKTALKNSITIYFQKIKKKGYLDQGIAQPQHGNLMNTLFLMIGFIPGLIGAVTNFIPFTIAKKLATAKVKKIEFFSSVRLGSYLGVYLIQYLILLILSFIVWKLWFLFAVLATPFLGYFAVIYFDKLGLWQAAQKVKAADRTELLQERKRILEAV